MMIIIITKTMKRITLRVTIKYELTIMITTSKIITIVISFTMRMRIMKTMTK